MIFRQSMHVAWVQLPSRWAVKPGGHPEPNSLLLYKLSSLRHFAPHVLLAQSRSLQCMQPFAASLQSVSRAFVCVICSQPGTQWQGQSKGSPVPQRRQAGRCYCCCSRFDISSTPGLSTEIAAFSPLLGLQNECMAASHKACCTMQAH